MIFADDGYLENPGWYISGPQPSRAVEHNGLTPAENAFISLSPTLLLVSDLFRASWGRKHDNTDLQRIQHPKSSRALSFSGTNLDQFDLDVLLCCVMQADTGEDGSPRPLRVDIHDLTQLLALKNTSTSRNRIETSLTRLEQARLVVENKRFSTVIRFFPTFIRDTANGAYILDIHQSIRNAFRDKLSLTRFMRERIRLGADGLGKWLHGLAYASGGRCAIRENRLQALSGSPLPALRFTAALDETMKTLLENRLLQHVAFQDNMLILQGNICPIKDSHCLFFS